jgi:transposase
VHVGHNALPNIGAWIMRYDLTDFEWSVIEPLLPTRRRGVKPKKNRCVLNGIFWVLRTGAPWRDMPERTAGSPCEPEDSAACKFSAIGVRMRAAYELRSPVLLGRSSRGLFRQSSAACSFVTAS